MYLSQHFSLAELTTTEMRGVDNTPSPEIIERLRSTAVKMEAVRSLLDSNPIHVTSGFRSPLLNKLIGGSKTSAHMSGFAVDFVCPRFGTPFQVALEIQKSKIMFDQLIWEEETWVHIAFGPGLRRDVLTKHRHVSSYVVGLVEKQGRLV